MSESYPAQFLSSHALLQEQISRQLKTDAIPTEDGQLYQKQKKKKKKKKKGGGEVFLASLISLISFVKIARCDTKKYLALDMVVQEKGNEGKAGEATPTRIRKAEIAAAWRESASVFCPSLSLAHFLPPLWCSRTLEASDNDRQHRSRPKKTEKA